MTCGCSPTVVVASIPGPQGPQGATGPQGPTGPAGPSYENVIVPSGDVTGATDYANIQAAITAAVSSTTSRVITFASGTFYVNALIKGVFTSIATCSIPLEIKGVGYAEIIQVTNNIGIFEFDLNANVFGGFMTFSNITLQYQAAQPATNTASICLGFRSSLANPSGTETYFQIYIDKLRCVNCFRGIANAQPSGQFALWGLHITNYYTNSRSGAGIWISSPVTVGQPNINIDHYLDSQSSSSCPDPAIRIGACDNLSIKNCEFLNVANNLPLMFITSTSTFLLEANKCEACTYSSVAAGPLFNYMVMVQNSWGTINGFTISNLTLSSSALSFKPKFLSASGSTSAGAIAVSNLEIGLNSGTDELFLITCGMKVVWLTPPTIGTLGSSPGTIGLYDAGGDSASSQWINFSFPPGGVVSADNGDASVTYAPFSTSVGVIGMQAVMVWNTPLTANRTFTLPTGLPGINNISDGITVTAVRTANATGASTLGVGSKSLTAGQSVTYVYQRLPSPNWIEIGYSSAL